MFRIRKIVLFIFTLFLIQNCHNQTSAKFNLYFEDDVALLINKKREFISGTYHLPKSENHYKEATEIGYNYVHVNPERSELDEAAKYGLKTWLSIGSITPKSRDEEVRKFEKKIIEWIVKNYKGFDYLFCANSGHHSNKATISGFSQHLHSLEVLEENFNIKVQNGKFVDFFEPFAVHIYKFNTKKNRGSYFEFSLA